MKRQDASTCWSAGDSSMYERSITFRSALVTETYEWIIKELGLEVAMLAGNHDLETNDSVYSANAARRCARLVWRSSAASVPTPSKWVTLPFI